MATFTVTNTFDSGVGSLRQAILDANGSGGLDIIVFDAGLAGQVIDLSSGVLAILDDLTIDGDINNDGQADITIDAQNNHGVFTTYDAPPIGGITANLIGLTLTGGNSGAYSGGALYVFDPADQINIVNSSIVGNTNMAGGGGIFTYGSVTLTNTTIADNTAYGGGGGMVVGIGGSATLNNSTVTNNSITGIIPAVTVSKALAP